MKEQVEASRNPQHSPPSCLTSHRVGSLSFEFWTKKKNVQQEFCPKSDPSRESGEQEPRQPGVMIRVLSLHRTTFCLQSQGPVRTDFGCCSLGREPHGPQEINRRWQIEENELRNSDLFFLSFSEGGNNGK